MSPTLSIIIVHYNVAPLLEKCLHSIRTFGNGISLEVIVVDNHSPKKHWQQLKTDFPEVHFISLEKNNGFAYANNIGAKMANGKYLLLLNPDTEIKSNIFPEIIQFIENQANFGCLGVRLHDIEGNFHPESKRSVPNLSHSFFKLFLPKRQSLRGYYRNDIKEDEIAEVEVITGAFFLCERIKYLNLGGLDESYFMYGEDIDLCYTFIRNGYVNWYYGKASVLHYKGESTVKDDVYIERFYGAMEVFSKKYHYPKNPILYFIVKIGLYFKKYQAKRKLKAE